MKFADGMLRGFLGPFSFSTSSSVVDFLPVDPPLVAADLTGAAVAMVVAGVSRSSVLADGLAARLKCTDVEATIKLIYV